MGACTSGDSTMHVKKEKGSFTAEYIMEEKLGEGRFGQVRIAKRRDNSEISAAKILDLRDHDDGVSGNNTSKKADAEKLKKARSEVNIMERIGTHDHCVQLVEAFQEKCLYYIVMEKCDATLMDELEQIPHAGVLELKRIFREMLLGIAYVHSLNLMHRDVKPNNFLFAGISKTVKLSDFGMSIVVPKRGTVTGHSGTPPYMSPEMIGPGCRGDKPYSQKTDIWSYGVTIYVLLYGGFPYQPRDESSLATKKVILEGLPRPSFAPAEGTDSPQPCAAATEFVRSVIHRSPQQRPTAEDALQLEFVAPPSLDLKMDVTRTASDLSKSGTPSPMQKESCQKVRDLQARVDNRAGLIAERDLDHLLEKLNAVRRHSFSEDCSKSWGLEQQFASSVADAGKDERRTSSTDDCLGRGRSDNGLDRIQEERQISCGTAVFSPTSENTALKASL